MIKKILKALLFIVIAFLIILAPSQYDQLIICISLAVLLFVALFSLGKAMIILFGPVGPN